jgi:hypothetical protein
MDSSMAAGSQSSVSASWFDHSTAARSLNHPAWTSNVVVMAELTESSFQPANEVEQLTGRDHLYQILCGMGIASGLALLWAMETVRNYAFRMLNALKIPVRHHKRGSVFPAGPRQA